jgi:hypothetical protein
MEPNIRVFIDEVGTHDLKSSDLGSERYLGLTGVMMSIPHECGEFADRLNAIKREIFGKAEIVLHRREILNGESPFEALQDADVRNRFNDLLLELLVSATYRVFTVVIDKKEHLRKYAVWRFHPYHYCLTVLLERYAQWLRRIGSVGDVLVESRGRKENMQLERAYRYIYDNGSDHVPVRTFRERLSSSRLKIQPKEANLAGLQLADLIANPCYRALICQNTGAEMTAEFSKRILQVLRKNKYLKNPYDGSIPGWGTKWLP